MTAALIAAVVLVLPGLALMSLWPVEGGWGLGRRLLAAPGVGLAGLALAFQFAWVLGLRLDATAIGVLVVACGVMAAMWVARNVRLPAASPDLLPPLLFAGILALTVWSRAQAVAGLETPLWWDSVHHTTIVQLMLDNGGLFSSWEPYAPLSTFTYHYGFHAAASALAWVSGLAAPAAVLLMGQVLNVCAVPVGYLLAERLTGRAWAGVAAALVTGLVSLMPAYYVNWGRYTQLAGLVILPVAAAVTVEALEKGGWRRLATASLLVAGLALTHYRVIIFYGAFVAALALVRAFQLRREPARLGAEAGKLAALGLASLALAAPWAWHLAQDRLPAYLARYAAPVTPAAAQWVSWYNSLRDVDAVLPPYLLWPAAAALAMGLLWRKRAAFLLILWVEGLFLAANPDWLGLRGAGEITNQAVLIALYVPISCAVGMAQAGGLDILGPRPLAAAAARWLLVAAIAAVGIWGAGESSRVVNPYFQLVTPADLRAMAWIRQNTPAGATFLANSERAYSGNTVVGTDAGWWLPLLAGRRGTVPVMIYATERSSPPGFAARTNALEETVRLNPPPAAESLAALRAAGVTHIYVGSRGGYLKPDEMAASPALETVYRADGVWVFRVLPAPTSVVETAGKAWPATESRRPEPTRSTYSGASNRDHGVPAAALAGSEN